MARFVVRDGESVILSASDLQKIFHMDNAKEIQKYLADCFESVRRQKEKQSILEKEFHVANPSVTFEQRIGVAYICDRRKCAKCSYPICTHTRDITHAKNFHLNGDIFEEKSMCLRKCTVDGKAAYFHKWIEKTVATIDAQWFDKTRPPVNTIMPHTEAFAIVEYEDGAVAEVELTRIKFI